MSENALRKHIAAHPRAEARATATGQGEGPARTSKATRPKRARTTPPPPPPEDDEAPITSRSPSSSPTARGKIDALLVSLQRVADGLPSDASVADRVAVLKASVQPIRLLGQLTGELGASDATVAASPHYRRIRTAIVDALAALEDGGKALRAVEAALAKLEPGRASTETEAAA